MNKRSTLHIFLASTILGGLLALAYFLLFNKTDKGAYTIRPEGISPSTTNTTPAREADTKRIPSVVIEETPAQIMARYGLNRVEDDPAALADAIARLAQSGDEKMLNIMAEHQIIPSTAAEALRKTLKQGGYKLNAKNPISEVGELERNKKIRWALNLENGTRILVDMQKTEAGKWQVTEISLPSDESEITKNSPLAPKTTDALSIIDGFIQATLAQRFDIARQFVDQAKVADATIVGICILFEEGKYQLRKKQPLRNMFSNDTNAGFLAYIQSDENSKETGNIGLTLHRQQPNTPWIITDIALDNLLQDYAAQFGDGDAYYTPLVKNPKGGDSLVLYFGFDEAILSPRSLRQLEIVAHMLKVDANKKIEISGHTDDVGSEKYNQTLSEARAEAVRQALITSGLTPEQVVTKGFGKSRQRRAVDTGIVNDPKTDTIRRANRRAEIYLDF